MALNWKIYSKHEAHIWLENAFFINKNDKTY